MTVGSITGKQWLILLTVQFTTVLFGITITSVGVILPQMKGALSATQDQVSWILTFNMVATATRSGRTLAAVVLGAESAKDRAEIAAGLLQDGFKPKIFPGSRPAVATFKSTRGPDPAVDLRDQICGKRHKQEGEEEPLLAGAAGRSALEPRFVVMDPVPVSTGIAGKDSSGSKAGSKIPIPRPRPPMPGDSASYRFDDAFGTSSTFH